jgi:hypothetical protein
VIAGALVAAGAAQVGERRGDGHVRTAAAKAASALSATWLAMSPSAWRSAT